MGVGRRSEEGYPHLRNCKYIRHHARGSNRPPPHGGDPSHPGHPFARMGPIGSGILKSKKGRTVPRTMIAKLHRNTLGSRSLATQANS